jgi:hypothetical protein
VEGKPQESDQGYAEEQPGEVADEGGNATRENRDREGAHPDAAEEGDDGKATGNPQSAG